MALPVCQVALTFRDREGNKGSMTIYCSPFLSPDDRDAFVAMMVGYVQPLSNAQITNVTVTRKINLAPYSEGLGVPDLTSRVVLLYSEGDVYEAIAIPSPQETLFENEGQYRGIRVDPLSTPMVTWMDNWNAFSSHIVTKEGLPFPSAFTVGGKTL